MPYKIVAGGTGCANGTGVYKINANGSEELVPGGCHVGAGAEGMAKKHLTALNIALSQENMAPSDPQEGRSEGKGSRDTLPSLRSLSESFAWEPHQVALYEAIETIAEELGAFTPGTDGAGAHYAPAAENPFVAQGMICANCAFYEGGACEVVVGAVEENSNQVEPNAVCKLWVIPNRLLELPDPVVQAMPEEEEPAPGELPEEQATRAGINPDGYAPTAEMKAEAERGLAWRSEYGRGGTEIGVARARDISNGRRLSWDTIQRMVSYFARHEVDKKAEGFRQGEPGYPSAGRIAWALWGGDAGRAWANRIDSATEAPRMTLPDKLVLGIGELIADHAAEMARLGAPASRELTYLQAEEVARRGMFAFGTAHHPGMTRNEWSLHRVRSFGYALLNDRFRRGVHDQDVLPYDHPFSTQQRSVDMATDDMMLERRYLPLTTGAAEIRADGEIPLRLSGYAALFNSASEPLPFTERIAPGAFTESLTRAARKEWEIRLLHGHDASQMLAATGSGSLRLNEDERGLRVEADLVPSEIGKHVALLVEREPQAMGFSFGFTIPQGGQRWNKDRTERTLTQVKLHEVSILTGQEPAYKATTNTAEVRALAERAGVDAERLSLAISALAWGNRLEEDDVMLLDAAVRQLTPRRAGGAPASVLGRLAELKKRGV